MIFLIYTLYIITVISWSTLIKIYSNYFIISYVIIREPLIGPSNTLYK